MEFQTLQELTETISWRIRNIGSNIECVKEDLDNYVGNDWTNYIEFDDEKYNRVKIFQNDHFEILLICWNKNQSTLIHKHPKNGCVFRTLQGTLYEKRYKPDVKTEYKLFTYDNTAKSSYIDDLIGVHKIESKDAMSVSIHVYSPPLFYS